MRITMAICLCLCALSCDSDSGPTIDESCGRCMSHPAPCSAKMCEPDPDAPCCQREYYWSACDYCSNDECFIDGWPNSPNERSTPAECKAMNR